MNSKNGTTKIPPIRVSTTRPDTIFGVTFLALAPEYANLSALISSENSEIIQEGIEQISKKLNGDKKNKGKEGVFLGSYAIHPFTKERIPLFVADYVLSDYGSGAVMGVPAHDSRDFEFSKKYNIPIKYVIRPNDSSIG